MKHHLGLPNSYMTTALLSRIQQFNRYLQYLPGMDNKFELDGIKKWSTILYLITSILLLRHPHTSGMTTKIGC